MLVLENVSFVMMVVTEGGESSQMTLIGYFNNLHKQNLEYSSIWLSFQDTVVM